MDSNNSNTKCENRSSIRAANIMRRHMSARTSAPSVIHLTASSHTPEAEERTRPKFEKALQVKRM